MIVYVVSFAPATSCGGAGGFHWSVNRSVAERAYGVEVAESASEGGSRVVRLVAVSVRPGMTRSEVTEALDAVLEGPESTFPALRQYVPARTEAGFVPLARRVSRIR